MTAAAPALQERKRKRSKLGFVEKTLAGISAGIENAVFSEENARRDGFLQRRDPRVKLLAFVVVVAVTALSRSLPVLALLYLAVLAVAAASALDLGLYLKRVWLGIPLFSGIVVLPSIFFVGSHVLLRLPLGFFTLEVHREGVAAAIVFVARVGVSVSLAVLLILSTRWADILKSLSALRVPSIFIVILAMTYRYIFLFLHTANGMFLARKSRSVAYTSGQEQRWWIVSSMGSLMSRSFRLSEDVYQAMLARGFDGRIRTFDDYHPGAADWLFLAGSLVLAVLAFFANRRLA